MRRIIRTMVALSLFLGLGITLKAQDQDAEAIIDKAVKAHLGSGKDAKKLGYRGKNKGTLFIAGMELDFAQNVADMAPTKFKEAMDLTVAYKKIDDSEFARP